MQAVDLRCFKVSLSGWRAWTMFRLAKRKDACQRLRHPSGPLSRREPYVQKVWRGHRTRAAQRRLWRAELAQLLDGAAGESASDALTRRPSSHGQQQPSPILSRFFAAAQPEAAEQLPLLCRVCLLARECIAHDADAPQRAFSQFDANRLAAIALRTLAYHRCAICLPSVLPVGSGSSRRTFVVPRPQRRKQVRSKAR